MRVTRSRWMPAVAIPVAIVAAAVVVPAAADADPALPRISSQDLLELVSSSTDVAYSGTIEQTSDLGLPDLGALGQGAGGEDSVSAALELLTASHTAKVYVAGPDTMRVQVLDRLAERDVVRDGQDAWLYDSESGEATHVTLPAGGADRMPATAPTPAAYAQQLLSSLDATTEVSVSGTARVAGRPAYELTLTPRSDRTLVGSVSLAVDAETGLPLSVEVLADGQEAPAFSIGLTDVSFDSPDASVFDFTPPAGAEVTEQDLSAGPPADPPAESAPELGAPDSSATSGATVTGEGWAAIISLPAAEAGASAAPSATADSSGMSALLDQSTTPVDGGRVLSTALLSVLITDDGRVLLGAVPAEALEAAAAQ
jgi:outer membrane lipoprotein-sorting protein